MKKMLFVLLMLSLSFFVYACGVSQSVIIQFETNGGNTLEDQTFDLNSGEFVLPIPVKEGFTFDGWYIDEDLSSLFSFSAILSSTTVTVYAKWIENHYIVTFMTNGGNTINPVTITETLLLQEPIREGFIFKGWYDNPNFEGNPILEISNSLNENKTLYAKWEFAIDCIYVGFSSTAFLSSDGILYTWGTNGYGQLGDGTDENKSTPNSILNQFSLFENEMIINMDFGYKHAGALTSSGRLFMWGLNTDYQIGNNTEIGFYKIPVEITDMFDLSTDEHIVEISLGDYHSSALTSSGRIFMWGWGWSNENPLGNGASSKIKTPTEITENFNLEFGEKIIHIAMGSYHSSALTSTGRLFTWGDNDYAQLGDGTLINRNLPTDITSQFVLNDNDIIIQIALGGLHSAALTSDGKLFMWGYNGSGALGNGTLIDSLIPYETTLMFNLVENEQINWIDLGMEHSSAVTTLGRIFTWGYNDRGQLGNGSIQDSSIPIDITASLDLDEDEIVMLSAVGGFHSGIITSKGRLFVWGRNSSGQLGDGTENDSLIPIEVTID